MIATVLTSGLLARPTKAEFLNTVTQNVGCVLNIGTCPPPIVNEEQTLPDENPPIDTTDPKEEGPSDDTTPPSVELSADPMLAGGASQIITISGAISDDNLVSYSLAVNGTVAQEESNMSQTSAGIDIPWNVSTPNVVPSGLYRITLDATDAAGNPSHIEVTVEVDNTAPDVDVSGGDVIIKEGSISPSTSASDTHTVASYYWTADAGNPGVINFDANVPEPSFTPNIEGTYVFYVSVADGLGNATTRQFSFSYAKELEAVPLPTLEDPTEALIDQSPSTPAVTPASTNPAIRNGRDEILENDDELVLGSTVSKPGETPPTTTIASIAPTGSGWSIFGVLWYWWLGVIAFFFAGWVALKKFVLTRIPGES